MGAADHRLLHRRTAVRCPRRLPTAEDHAGRRPRHRPGPDASRPARADPATGTDEREEGRPDHRGAREQLDRPAHRGRHAAARRAAFARRRVRLTDFSPRPPGSDACRTTTSCSTTPTSAATTPSSSTPAPASSSPICGRPTASTSSGERIRGTATLQDGDAVRVCDHEFTFEVRPQTPSRNPSRERRLLL